MRIERDVVLATDLEDAWRLLTDPDDLAAWLGRPVTLDLRPGGAAAYVEPDGTTRLAVVERVVEGEHLSFVWWDPEDAVASRVEFQLTEVDGGTRVSVSETRASVAGASRRLPIGALWDDRLFELERHCLTRQFALV